MDFFEYTAGVLLGSVFAVAALWSLRNVRTEMDLVTLRISDVLASIILAVVFCGLLWNGSSFAYKDFAAVYIVLWAVIYLVFSKYAERRVEYRYRPVRVSNSLNISVRVMMGPIPVRFRSLKEAVTMAVCDLVGLACVLLLMFG